MKKVLLFLIGLLILFSSCQETYQQQFVSTDIDHFWEAYDSITATADTSAQQQYLQELFLDKGTEGLSALMKVRRYTPAQYLEAINAYPKFWQSIRESTTQSHLHYAEIDQHIAKLKALYPALTPSTIYFSMGVFRSNGTIQGPKVLIGSEMALSHKGVDISELPEHPKTFNSLYNPVDDIGFLVTHEYVHTQQKELTHNLLNYCIYEGIPEFIAVLVTGKKPYLSAIEYAEVNYEQVRDKFEADMYNTIRTYHWLWSTNKIFGERDLGYGVGYAMAKHYYENAPDKKEAIRAMIELDFANDSAVEAFVDASGYLTKPLGELYEAHDRSRPYVLQTSGVINGSRGVKPGITPITMHFSEPMNSGNTGVDFGDMGKDAFPQLIGERVWSEGNTAWTITAELEPNQHYQILISQNFRSENGIQLKPYLVEFWTGE